VTKEKQRFRWTVGVFAAAQILVAQTMGSLHPADGKRAPGN
jgi:hypothetical protein